VAVELAARRHDRIGPAPAGAIVLFPLTALAISSSDIRARLAAGRSARYLIPETVFNYIESGRLYRAPA
jgi:nicotinate-nucleotide adenylyltransferase